MSLFSGGSAELFHARQDEFMRYVEDEVNPARVAAGLSEIRPHEARECFRIIDEFATKWDSLGKEAK